ncbi:MAG: SUMF1/EgtB/PvdO family nonheme iron enzyme [Verrucomicrobiota bacterium]
MNSAPDERLLGEYRLKELLDENSLSKTWLAEQVSVARLVLVDELRPDQSANREIFLADVRAKAAVDHPLIGSVYEAVAEPGLCFYAHELLPGVTLAERQRAGEPFAPGRLAHLLRRVAEAHLQHEVLDQSTSPMDLDAVYQDEHGVIRLKNLAIAGPRTEEQSLRDIVHFGNVLVPLVADGQPGATRVLTLLGWMRGEGLEAPITWGQTRDFCMQIEHQLADPLSILTPTKHGSRAGKKQPVALIALATGVVLLGIVIAAVKMRPPVPQAPPRAPLPQAVTIAAGKHPTPDGIDESLPAFRISANEITIGQYNEFLETLEVLAKDQREKAFDPADQPSAKVSHEPTDWPALLAAAKSNGTWQDQPVTLDSPVGGVDWWDAAAYAEWKKARLPTQEEWFAALSMDVQVPAALQPGPFAPVTAATTDRTPAGLIGMAGSVCEWTSKPAPNPANPLGEKLWVVIGGSYLKPGSNALTREWTADRSLRRPDLGFRIVFDAQ